MGVTSWSWGGGGFPSPETTLHSSRWPRAGANGELFSGDISIPKIETTEPLEEGSSVRLTIKETRPHPGTDC